ncbi:hypothetical protein C4580_04700 [Candidatus Woesearchaeota archaeon]|nr:MAG: hypothetical protein C4580_04700 [Candidatus Woesearchaeota archaeon]
MENSIYDRIGPLGTLDVLLTATPWYALPAMPLTFITYRQLLRTSNNIGELEESHVHLRSASAWYCYARPLHRIAQRKLRESYGVR